MFLSRETGISGNFVGRIKGAKCPFDLQFLKFLVILPFNFQLSLHLERGTHHAY